MNLIKADPIESNDLAIGQITFEGGGVGWYEGDCSYVISIEREKTICPLTTEMQVSRKLTSVVPT